jgi:hypothetical protein
VADVHPWIFHGFYGRIKTVNHLPGLFCQLSPRSGLTEGPGRRRPGLRVWGAIKNAAWMGRGGYFLSSSIISIGWG